MFAVPSLLAVLEQESGKKELLLSTELAVSVTMGNSTMTPKAR
jgi:hypothetical protein